MRPKLTRVYVYDYLPCVWVIDFGCVYVFDKGFTLSLLIRNASCTAFWCWTSYACFVCHWHSAHRVNHSLEIRNQSKQAQGLFQRRLHVSGATGVIENGIETSLRRKTCN